MKRQFTILESSLIILLIGGMLRIAIILWDGWAIAWESLNPRY